MIVKIVIMFIVVLLSVIGLFIKLPLQFILLPIAVIAWASGMLGTEEEEQQ